jgi:hypothetical protein
VATPISYFHAKSDSEFIHESATAVVKLWNTEANASKRINTAALRFPARTEIHELIVHEAHRYAQHAELRARVARGVTRTNRIANRLGLLGLHESYPVPAVGGPVITVTLVDAILFKEAYDDGWSIFGC